MKVKEIRNSTGAYYVIQFDDRTECYACTTVCVGIDGAPEFRVPASVGVMWH